MIRMFFTGCSWGVQGFDANNESGAQINVLNGTPDDPNAISLGIPFLGNSLAQLIANLSKYASEDQKKELAPLFMSGVILPDGTDTHKGNLKRIK